MRLGIYMDLVYRSDGRDLWTDQAVIHFATKLASQMSEIVLIGRLDPTPGTAPYRISESQVRLLALPHYPSVASVASLVGGVRRSCAAFAAELDRLDAVWLFGPHPLSILFACIARRRGVPVFLGVRQDFVRYIRERLPSRRWLWAVSVAHLLERAYRLLARSMPTVTVGDDLAARYRSGGAPVLATGFSLLSADEVVSVEDAVQKPWEGELRLFNVGRLDPEKNPTLLPDVLARLRAEDPRWRLGIAGEGPMSDAVRRRAEELGVSDAVELLGYVPNGPRLWAEYRRSHAFLHVSFTEGLPQVLWEAQGAGLPIVATDVGGIGAALQDGASALLIPPGSAEAAVAAIERLSADEALRRRLISAGLEQARLETLDVHVDRIARFIRANVGEPSPAVPAAGPADPS
ncbi:MAG: glycosyltransferase [Actinomycetota bacterium]|nr:glycosyltransferase [Actinomycetota bacterium]